jgi:hypothetical protein
MAAEVSIQTGEPERAAGIAREHGFQVEHRDAALVARFAPGEEPRAATAALNRVLCLAGVPVHALAPRELTLETLYHRAGLPAESAA